MKPTNVHTRFADVIKALGIKPTVIAEEIGLGEKKDAVKLYNIINGKAKPSWATIEQLVSHYPQISVEYLAKGTGMPLLIGNRVAEREEVPFKEVPFVAVKAYGSFIAGYGPDEGYKFIEDTYPVHNLDTATNGHLVIEVEGNSMSPQIQPGMKVLVKRVESDSWEYINGVHAVLFDDYFVIKRIKHNHLSDRGSIELYSDFDGSTLHVKGEAIRGIWKALKSVDGDIQ